jgi:hypothetical protein
MYVINYANTFLNKKEGNEPNELYISILHRQIENNAEYNKNLLIWVNFECCCKFNVKYYRIYLFITTVHFKIVPNEKKLK